MASVDVPWKLLADAPVRPTASAPFRRPGFCCPAACWKPTHRPAVCLVDHELGMSEDASPDIDVPDREFGVLLDAAKRVPACWLGRPLWPAECAHVATKPLVAALR